MENTGNIYTCRICGKEVSENEKVCPFCNSGLEVSHESRIMVLKIFQTEFEAEAAKTQLDTAGIHSFISADNYGGMMPALSHSEGVKLMINSDDFQKACEILRVMGMY